MENRIAPISTPITKQYSTVAQHPHNSLSFGGRYPIYVITNERKVLHYDSVKTASEITGTPAAAIYNCLSNKKLHKIANGLIFRKAEDIFGADKKIDYRKVKEAAEAYKSICIIDKNLNIYTPATTEEAIGISGLKKANYSSYLAMQKLTKKGKLIIPREKIEDEYGNISIEKAQALRKKLQRTKEKGGFYAVSENNEVSYYKNCTEFAKKIGRARTAAHQCLIGQIKKLCGYVLLRRNLVENELGELDAKRLNTALANRLSGRRTPSKKVTSEIVAIYKNGEVKTFNGIEAAEEGTGKSSATILRILKGKTPATKSGWHYVIADELKDENGKISKEKIQTRYQEIFNSSKQ